MNNKQLSKDLLFVATSRMISLFSGVAIGLLLPKIFSVIDYGYFKIFTLYAVYMTLTHFGFVDGILLKLAGKKYCDLEMEKMRTYTCFFMIFEGIIAIIMVFMAIAFIKGEYFFLAIMLATNMLAVNLTTYYQFVSQAVQRFSEYSAKNIAVSLAKILLVGGLLGISYFKHIEISYRVYLVGINLLDYSMLFWYVWIYRDITFGKKLHFANLITDIRDIFKVGIVLTMAYQVSHLVLVLDRQFVSFFFSTEIFAVYSFAYNIISMISTMISSISVVFFPILKSGTKEFVTEYYKKSAVFVSIISAFSLSCYFPFETFIDWFLPNYSYSLEYLVIILPSSLFAAVITVVMFTVSKVQNMNYEFFKDSALILGIGLITNYFAYIIFKSPEAISCASVLVMIIWFLIVDAKIRKRIGVSLFRECVYLIIVSVDFFVITKFIDGELSGFIVFMIILIIWSLIFNFEFVRRYIVKNRDYRRKW